jgi:hypothetical protein
MGMDKANVVDMKDCVIEGAAPMAASLWQRTDQRTKHTSRKN